MPLSTIKTPFTSNELALALNANFTFLDSTKADASDLADYIPMSYMGANNGVATLNSSGQVIQNALTATTATDYNTTAGGIKTKFDSIDSQITNITNGNTVVGKAVTLQPATPPGNNKFFGTSPSGVIGWYDLPEPEEGITGPYQEPFESTDVRWSSPVSGIYTLTIEHDGAYVLGVYRELGLMHEQVHVDVQRDDDDVLIRCMQPFDGYVLMM